MESLITQAEHFRLTTYTDVLVATIVVYDYALTLSSEIELVWKTSWTLTKFLYFIQRYTPLIDTVILVFFSDFNPSLSWRVCHITYSVSGWMYVTSIATSEIILSIRVLAIWQRQTRILIFVCVFYALCFLPVFICMGLFVVSMTFGPSPIPTLGCFVTGGSPILVFSWLLLMVFDAGMMILMMIPGYRAYKTGGGTALFNVVYRDGVLYYIVLFTLALANVVGILLLPADLGSLFSSLERVMHSIVTTRILHHIRHQVRKPYRLDHDNVELRMVSEIEVTTTTLRFVEGEDVLNIA